MIHDRSRLAYFLILTSTALVSHSAVAQVLVVTDSDHYQVAPGANFDVAVSLDRTFEAGGVASFGVRLGFDPAKVALQATPVTVVPELNHDFVGGSALVTVTSGSIAVSGFTQDDGFTFDSYTGLPLLTFHLTSLASAPGAASDLLLSDPNPGAADWVTPGFVELDGDVGYTSARVSIVPEPTVSLGAMVMLIMAARRRRQTGPDKSTSRTKTS
jgi:hypothetical protein